MYAHFADEDEWPKQKLRPKEMQKSNQKEKQQSEAKQTINANAHGAKLCCHA